MATVYKDWLPEDFHPTGPLWLVLLASDHGDDDVILCEAVPSREEQEDDRQVIGMMFAGYVVAKTADAALQAATDAFTVDDIGCVA